MYRQVKIIEHPSLQTIRQNECKAKRLNLTSREVEVVELICLGYTMKEVASALFISTSTVISHKKKLVSKFGAKNLVRLGVLAERYKLIVR